MGQPFTPAFEQTGASQETQPTSSKCGASLAQTQQPGQGSVPRISIFWGLPSQPLTILINLIKQTQTETPNGFQRFR